MFRVQPVQNIHMHQVVSFYRGPSADYCRCEVRDCVIGLHRDVTCYEIFDEAFIEGLDVFIQVIETYHMSALHRVASEE